MAIIPLETRTISLLALVAWAIVLPFYYMCWIRHTSESSRLNSMSMPDTHPAMHITSIPATSNYPTVSEFALPYPTLYPKPLGKEICLLDVDSRPYDMEGGMMNKSHLEWKNVQRTSAGRLGHYLYAKMHGYDYKFVQATPFTDRYNTWLKVRELGAALRHSYRFVIFTDGDIVFSRPEIPLEYLLSYWNISSSISLALAEDPDAGYNFDSRGRLNQNCGFIIAQNNAKTHEIMKDWLECPDGTRYEDCDHWKNNHYHEQGAFSNHVRYDYGDWIRTLPCDHANGAPEGGQGCTGKYVRHYWVSKDAIKPAVDETFMQSIFGKAHRQFVENLNETFWDHSSGMAQTGDGEA